MKEIAVVYHSGYGHTKKQASAVFEGVCENKSVKAHLIAVEEIESHWETLERASAIIFGSPTYMGSVSAQFKTFMDATSKMWFEQKWKNKIAAGFTNSGSQNGDKLNTLVQMMIFAMQHGMVWVGLGLLPGNNSSHGSSNDINRLGNFSGATAQSNVDQSADIVPPESDLRTAKFLGTRVAEIVLKSDFA